MTEQIIKNVLAILEERFDFDEVDLVEFILALERKTSEKIPDEWTNIM